jgi:hypothetical protein
MVNLADLLKCPELWFDLLEFHPRFIVTRQNADRKTVDRSGGNPSGGIQWSLIKYKKSTTMGPPF